MNINMKIAVPFKAAYPNEEPRELSEYLEGISKKTLLKVSPFFLGFNAQNSKYSEIQDFLSMFFSKGNIMEASQIFDNIKVFSIQTVGGIDAYEIPYVTSSLCLFEYVFDNVHDETQDIQTNEEMEVNILKAYLLLNQINTEENGLVSNNSTRGLSVFMRPPAMLLSLQLNNCEFLNYSIPKLFTTQIMRAIRFFEFLDSNPDCKILLQEFYNEYEVKNYKEYLKKITALGITVIKSDMESHTDIIFDNVDKMKDDISFLEKFITNKSNELQDIDFRILRSNPIHKIGEGKYRIICRIFILDMIYNGLYWKFKPINDRLPKGEKVKNFYNLKTYDFSEKYVLHNVLSEYYGRRFFQKNGDELDKEFEGAPDYYMRNGKRVFLFESKDIMLSAEVKQSSDFSLIKEELSKKLYKKEDGTPKAIMQIIRSVRHILKGQLAFDKRLKQRNIVIHPILVLHYRMFNAGGLNKVLNLWFQDELKKLQDEGLDISKVRPFTIIDIDTLIFHKDTFSSRKLNLEDCLLEYQNDYLNFSIARKRYNSEDEAVQASKNSCIPFSFYLDTKIEKLNIRAIPKEFKDKAYSLFDE